MHYFTIDSKQVVSFQNTSDLAAQINQLIAALRTGAGRIHPDLQAWMKKKTPGPTMVQIGVKLVLKNNGFNARTLQFEYQGRIGVVTRPINRKMNSMINERLPSKSDVAEAVVRSFIGRQLAQSPHIPAGIAEKISGPLASLVVEKAAEAAGMKVDAEDIAGLVQAAKGAAESAASSLASAARSGPVEESSAAEDQPDRFAETRAAAVVLAGAGRTTAGATVNLFEVDREAGLVRFEHTDEFADGVNGLIEAIRALAASLPWVGADVGALVREKTPGPRTVRLGVKAALRGQAFDYQKMEFHSTGSRFGTNRMANHFINKQIAARKAALLDTTALVMKGTEFWVGRQLEAVPAPVRTMVAEQIAIRVAAFVAAQGETAKAS